MKYTKAINNELIEWDTDRLIQDCVQLISKTRKQFNLIYDDVLNIVLPYEDYSALYKAQGNICTCNRVENCIVHYSMIIDKPIVY